MLGAGLSEVGDDVDAVASLLKSRQPSGEDVQLAARPGGSDRLGGGRGNAVAMLVPPGPGMAKEAALVLERESLP